MAPEVHEADVPFARIDSPNAANDEGALVRPESAAGRVFFLTHTPTVNGWGIAIFDSATFSSAGSIDVPGVTGVPRRLIPWGADGLAFRTDTDQVFLIRGVPGLALTGIFTITP